MKPEGFSDGEYSSDASSHPFFERHAVRQGHSMDTKGKNMQEKLFDDGSAQLTPVVGFPEGGQKAMPLEFGLQLQEMVVNAVRQATASLVGSSSDFLHFQREAPVGFLTMSSEEPVGGNTWNEATYHMTEARRRKKPDMMRTSAGEDSDSQEDFPVPENCTAEQRALRTRRLNRWRGKRARDLTSNRKAVKKLPYVIHVDGTSKPKGIHRHLWKAAVRGQCGRLDPCLDNINHHPKKLVDSIWYALEKEWKFEGFAHKSREMFEKSATKFMRNRKMQLKYKCQKSADGMKPEDVNDTHWKKIVELTKKSKTLQASCTSKQSIEKGKSTISDDCMQTSLVSREVERARNQDKEDNKFADAVVEEGKDLAPSQRESEDERSRKTSEFKPPMGVTLASEENMDAQLRNLQRQILWLERSIKAKEHVQVDITEVPIHVTKEKSTMSDIRRASEVMKENQAPSRVCSTSILRSFEKPKEAIWQRDSSNEGVKCISPLGEKSAALRNVLEEVPDVNKVQMECGDVICMSAIMQGKEEEVGKGVLMGFAGSKLSRKVIPKGWCSIKVSSFNVCAGLEACPFPYGWKDHIKYKTLRDTKDRMILWPENLLHM